MVPFFTDDTEVLRRWTKHWQELHNYELRPDTSYLGNMPNTNGETEDGPILQEEVEGAVYILKGGKSLGVDNVPADFLKCRGPEIIKVLTTICQKF